MYVGKDRSKMLHIFSYSYFLRQTLNFNWYKLVHLVSYIEQKCDLFCELILCLYYNYWYHVFHIFSFGNM